MTVPHDYLAGYENQVPDMRRQGRRRADRVPGPRTLVTSPNGMHSIKPDATGTPSDRITDPATAAHNATDRVTARRPAPGQPPRCQDVSARGISALGRAWMRVRWLLAVLSLVAATVGVPVVLLAGMSAGWYLGVIGLGVGALVCTSTTPRRWPWAAVLGTSFPAAAMVAVAVVSLRDPDRGQPEPDRLAIIGEAVGLLAVAWALARVAAYLVTREPPAWMEVAPARRGRARLLVQPDRLVLDRLPAPPVGTNTAHLAIPCERLELVQPGELAHPITWSLPNGSAVDVPAGPVLRVEGAGQRWLVPVTDPRTVARVVKSRSGARSWTPHALCSVIAVGLVLTGLGVWRAVDHQRAAVLPVLFAVGLAAGIRLTARPRRGVRDAAEHPVWPFPTGGAGADDVPGRTTHSPQ
ncbi:hypothetical protein GCM10010484_67350 [Actinokineospora globicatena]